MLSNRRKTYTETDVPSKIVGQNSDGSYRIMKGSDMDKNRDPSMVDTVNRIVDANTSAGRVDPGIPNLPTAINSGLNQIGGGNTYGVPQANNNFVINVNSRTDGMVIVETDHEAKRFSFYTPQKNFIGSFSVYEFIKYVTSNVSDSFLPTVDSYSATTIIEKYIGSVRRSDSPTARFEIRMLNYVESPFMGNVETLVKFYTFITEFENTQMMMELNTGSINSGEAIKIRDIFDLMVYTLLTHILKIIAALTNKIAANPGDSSDRTREIKDSLLRYSVSIMYRLSKFVKKEVNQKLTEIDRLDEDLLRIQNIRSDLQSKLDSVQRSVDQQNTRIDYMIKSGIQGTKTPSKEVLKPDIEADIETDIESDIETDIESDIETDNASKTDIIENTEVLDLTESSAMTSSRDKNAIMGPMVELSRDPNDMDSDVENIINALEGMSGESASVSNTERGFMKNRPGQQIMTSAAQSDRFDSVTLNSVSNAPSAPVPITGTTTSVNSTNSASGRVADTPQSLEDLLMT